jgi:2-amino-4-hydroxy-6-hydroxymethyldihydropteridine diphosphokinase
MGKTYLLLGGNIGNRAKYLKSAREQISRFIGGIEKASSIYETEPWGFSHETPFLNQVVISITGLHPGEIMLIIRDIEKGFGRVREKEHYSARTIDIDILFYDDMIINREDLVIPHPRLHERRFVLVPLAEVEPDLVHPVFKKSISVLNAECDDKLMVRKFEDPGLAR